MDIDAGTVLAALREGPDAVQKVQRYGVGTQLLVGPAKRAWFFIEQHVDKHGVVPTAETLRQFVPDFRAPDVAELDSLEWYVSELKYREKQRRWELLGPDIGKLVDGRLFDRAAERIKSFMDEMEESIFRERDMIRSLFDLTGLVKQRYLDVMAGKIGVPYPWPSLNEMTLGTDVSDMNGFVGRLGMGKTQTLLLSCHHAWRKGEEGGDEGDICIFVSPEMKQIALAQRFFTFELAMQPGPVRRAKLDDFMREKFFAALESLNRRKGVYIIADEYRITLDLIRAAIVTVRRNLPADQRKKRRISLYVDGPYLVMAEKGLGRQENAEMMADGLRDLARRDEVALNLSMQFNRTVQKNDPATVLAEGIGLTDAFGWNCANVFALVQTDDMRADKEMLLKGLKAREADGNNEVLVRWDWENNRFEELSGPRGKYKDDDFVAYGAAGAPAPADGDDDDLPF